MVITITEQAPPPSVTDTRDFSIKLTGPTVTYTVNTVLTSNPAVVRDWIENLLTHFVDSYLKRKLILGIAIQPGLLSGQQAAIITICSGRNCLMVRCNLGAVAQLSALLKDRRITFVSLSRAEETRLRLSPLVDMHPDMPLNVLGFVSCGHRFLNSMVRVIAEEVGKIWYEDAKTGCEFSDWEAQELSLEQVRYATVEALLPLLVGDGIGVWMFSPVYQRN